ncbi:hypothetical protein IE81DRAFT_70125 [Ceraceosorus guamensis]|uniref:Uncharacterized protein n=1 Tax=Ceraceosorus guamensis TaxID=1522189 RepID=A0A316VMN5_9BASI|nr:hypothetical protein IE81DRAFT_70125 [Ceraceosorus guamensis]PWN38842.1 hypothetical protein IE81DRAFT_70125 [Ceraceosorus guamensis]
MTMTLFALQVVSHSDCTLLKSEGTHNIRRLSKRGLASETRREAQKIRASRIQSHVFFGIEMLGILLTANGSRTARATRSTRALPDQLPLDLPLHSTRHTRRDSRVRKARSVRANTGIQIVNDGKGFT